MQGAIHGDLTAAADALAQALRKVDFLLIASGMKEIEALAPGKFLTEIMDEIAFSAAKIRQASQQLVREPQPGART